MFRAVANAVPCEASTKLTKPSTSWTQTWDQLIAGKRTWSRVSAPHTRSGTASGQVSPDSSRSSTPLSSESSQQSTSETTSTSASPFKLSYFPEVRKQTSRKAFQVTWVEFTEEFPKSESSLRSRDANVVSYEDDQAEYEAPIYPCEDEECNCCDTLIDCERPDTTSFFDALAGCAETARTMALIRAELVALERKSVTKATHQRVWDLRADLELCKWEHENYNETFRRYRPSMDSDTIACTDPSPQPPPRLTADMVNATDKRKEPSIKRGMKFISKLTWNREARHVESQTTIPMGLGVTNRPALPLQTHLAQGQSSRFTSVVSTQTNSVFEQEYTVW